MLPGVDHLRHTLDIEHNAFSRGLPEWGAHLADDLERLVHDASTIAATLIRTAGDTIALSPPLIISTAQIDELITRLGEVLKAIA